MSSIFPDLMQFVWIAVALIGGALQITAAALLLRHRGMGPWIMMITGCLSLLLSIAHHSLLFIGNARQLWGQDNPIPFHNIMQSLGFANSFMWILFSAGLLVTAISLRGVSARLADIENIVAQRDLR
jgi:hypothetical protein